MPLHVAHIESQHMSHCNLLYRTVITTENARVQANTSTSASLPLIILVRATRSHSIQQSWAGQPMACVRSVIIHLQHDVHTATRKLLFKGTVAVDMCRLFPIPVGCGCMAAASKCLGGTSGLSFISRQLQANAVLSNTGAPNACQNTATKLASRLDPGAKGCHVAIDRAPSGNAKYMCAAGMSFYIPERACIAASKDGLLFSQKIVLLSAVGSTSLVCCFSALLRGRNPGQLQPTANVDGRARMQSSGVSFNVDEHGRDRPVAVPRRHGHRPCLLNYRIVNGIYTNTTKESHKTQHYTD